MSEAARMRLDDKELSNIIRLHILMGVSYSVERMDLPKVVADAQKHGKKAGYKFESNRLVREVAMLEKKGLIRIVDSSYQITPDGLFELRATVADIRRIYTRPLDGGSYGK